MAEYQDYILEQLKNLIETDSPSGFTGKAVEYLMKTYQEMGYEPVMTNKGGVLVCLGGKEDAAAAAVLYGQVCAAVYSACGAIFHWRPGKARRVSVDLQYQTEEHQVDFSGKASIRLLFLLQEGIILLWKALPFFRKLQANQTERISQTRKQGEVK